MIEKTIYIAFDGCSFDDEYTCRDYESTKIAEDVGGDLLLYDKNGNKIEKIDDISADKIDYIIIKSEKAYNYVEEQMDYYGNIFPERCKAIDHNYICSFYYDCDENDWLTVEEKIKSLQNDIEELNKFLIK